MGDKDLEARGDGKQTSYSILAFPAALLPIRYEGFVKGKWKRTLRTGNDYFKLIETTSYFNAYEKYINILLSRPNSVLRVAVLTDDVDVALGWSLVEGSSLHYLFMRHEQRNQGIGRLLVPVKVDKITHLTRIGISYWRHNFPQAIFDPFA